MASTSPASARRTASSTAWPAIRPAASGVAPRCPLPSKVTSASSGRSASAFSTTSGPIPRGSPSVTASRGRRLETDVDVRGATQQVEMVLDGELLAQAVPDAILHLVEPQLALGKALQQLEHHEPRPPRSGGDFEHRLQPGNGVLTDRLLVIGRQLGQGEGVSQLGLARVGVATGQRVERRAVGERVVHRIGLTPGDGDLRRGNGGLDQDVARQDLRRLRALHLNDVEAELGAHHVGDGARPQAERDVLELLDHHAAAEPPQRAALLPRDAVRRVLLRYVGKPGPAGPPQRRDEGVPQLQRSEEHTSELQSLAYLVCRLLLEKKKKHRYL